MEYRLSSHQRIYSFSKEHSPVLTVPCGASILFDTCDCFSNQLQSNEDQLESLDFDRVNPATGPVYIEGAEPGDVLKIRIDEIEVAEKGVMMAEKGFGVLADKLTGAHFKIFPIEDGKVLFNDKVHIPVNPMIGVIGVAPSGEGISCGTPGSHGGNMDNRMITAGAVLYLPVFVPGALFGLGDLHAAMGDGEIGVTGVEVQGRVRLSLEVLKDWHIHNPVLENEAYFSTIASAKTLDQAAENATLDMAELIRQKTGMEIHELNMLMSAAGQLQICQVVDPLRTARFLMPWSVLNVIGFSL